MESIDVNKGRRKQNIGKKSWYKLEKYIFILRKKKKNSNRNDILENKSKFYSVFHYYRYCDSKQLA